MPYLASKQRRRELDAGARPVDGAELNYCISRLADGFVADHGLAYHTLEEIVGAMESAKAEFQRRIVGPYEETKLKDHGEVYEEAAWQLTARKAVAGSTGKGFRQVASGV